MQLRFRTISLNGFTFFHIYQIQLFLQYCETTRQSYYKHSGNVANAVIHFLSLYSTKMVVRVGIFGAGTVKVLPMLPQRKPQVEIARGA